MHVFQTNMEFENRGPLEGKNILLATIMFSFHISFLGHSSIIIIVTLPKITMVHLKRTARNEQKICKYNLPKPPLLNDSICLFSEPSLHLLGAVKNLHLVGFLLVKILWAVKKWGFLPNQEKHAEVPEQKAYLGRLQNL